MSAHYRESVAMLADLHPGSALLSALWLELDRLEAMLGAGEGAAAPKLAPS